MFYTIYRWCLNILYYYFVLHCIMYLNSKIFHDIDSTLPFYPPLPSTLSILRMHSFILESLYFSLPIVYRNIQYRRLGTTRYGNTWGEGNSNPPWTLYEDRHFPNSSTLIQRFNRLKFHLVYLIETTWTELVRWTCETFCLKDDRNFFSWRTLSRYSVHCSPPELLDCRQVWGSVVLVSPASW